MNLSPPEDAERKNIVVFGCGVGGLRFALSSEKKLSTFPEWKLIVIDENDYHQHIHRIHEIVGQRANPSDLAVPFSHLFKGKRIQFIQARVEDLDVGGKSVITDKQRIPFDILVIAPGSHTEFYGIKGLRENSLTLKTIAEAVLVKAKVEELFSSSEDQRIVIGGGGFTGVELMGELLDLIESGAAGKKKIDLILVEAMDQLLPGWDSGFARATAERLRSRGVEVILNDGIAAAEPGRLILKSGRCIEASLIVWTGGVTRDEVCGTLFEMKSRRLCVDEYCRAVGHKTIFVVGDCALIQDPKTGKIFPPSAHIAMESAEATTRNVYATIVGDPMVPYRPRHFGEIVTLGRGDAIGVLAGIRLNGLIARVAKKMVHLAYVYSIGGFGLLLEGRGVGKNAHFDFDR